MNNLNFLENPYLVGIATMYAEHAVAEKISDLTQADAQIKLKFNSNVESRLWLDSNQEECLKKIISQGDLTDDQAWDLACQFSHPVRWVKKIPIIVAKKMILVAGLD